MPQLVDYLRDLRAAGPITVIGGHYRWPGLPDRFAQESACDMFDAAAALESKGITQHVFLDDIAASVACTAVGCDISGPTRVGTLTLPEVESWLRAHLPEVEAMACGVDSAHAWQVLARPLGVLLRAQGISAWPTSVAQLVEDPGEISLQDWLEGVELLTYMAARPLFRPLMLARALARSLPAVLFERSMVNAASRMLHKLKKDAAITGLALTTDGDGRLHYQVAAPDGRAIELRYEEDTPRGQRAANKCAAILAQLFFQCTKGMAKQGTSRALSLVYLVPCYDRTRLQDGMWAFATLFHDVRRWFATDQVRVTAAFYCSPERDELMFEQLTVTADAEPQSRLGQLGARRPAWASARPTPISVVYVDHNATTPIDPDVLQEMLPFLTTSYGNSASTYSLGWRSEAAVSEAAEHVARLINAEPDEIVFTSGATESNNWLLGMLVAEGARVLVTSPLEHKSVLACAEALAAQGVRFESAPIDGQGRLDHAALESLDLPRNAVVSLMAANNEIHGVLDLERVGRWCAERELVFHSDAAQALGRVPLHVKAQGIDALSMSAHKIYGPKGVGALFVSRRLQRVLRPMIVGGGQQRNLRSGTVPTPLIVGFGKACEIAVRVFTHENERLLAMSQQFLTALSAHGVPHRLLGPDALEHRRPGSLCVLIPGLDATRLCEWIPDVALSQGSACNSRGIGSHVLRSLGLSLGEAKSVVRLAFGRFNADSDPALVALRLAEAFKYQGRTASSYSGPSEPFLAGHPELAPYVPPQLVS